MLEVGAFRYSIRSRRERLQRHGITHVSNADAAELAVGGANQRDIFPLRRPYIRICRTEEQNAIGADSCSQMRDATVVAHKSDMFKDGSEMGQRKIFGKLHAGIFPNWLEPVRFRLIRLPADDKNRSAKI